MTMRLEDVKIGMRVRLSDDALRRHNPDLGPEGTVMAFNDPREVFGAVFPVDVKFDRVDYDLPVFQVNGQQVYDMVHPDEVEPA